MFAVLCATRRTSYSAGGVVKKGSALNKKLQKMGLYKAIEKCKETYEQHIVEKIVSDFTKHSKKL